MGAVEEFIQTREYVSYLHLKTEIVRQFGEHQFNQHKAKVCIFQRMSLYKNQPQ